MKMSLKWKQGWVESKEGRREDIIVDPIRDTGLIKDLLIGGVMIGAGIYHIITKSLKHGALAQERGEYAALVRAGIIEED